MNKLLVSDIIDLNNSSYNLICEDTNVKIDITGSVSLYLYNQVITNLEININENSVLNLYKYNQENEGNLIVNINQSNNTKLNYNESIINGAKNQIIINNYLKGNNNESLINIRNISNKDSSEIIINVEIEKDTVNNIALEDLKGINNGGIINIEPNIICLSNEVVANHLTTIGCIDKELISYLMSKGISIDKAKELILNGFIYSNMDENFKKNFGGE